MNQLKFRRKPISFFGCALIMLLLSCGPLKNKEHEAIEPQGAETQGIEHPKENRRKANFDNYTKQKLSEDRVSLFFGIEKSDIINQQVVARTLSSMGIDKSDASRTATPKYIPTEQRRREFYNELLRYSNYYFEKSLSDSNAVQAALKNQGGLTTAQFIAYARIGFGAGACQNRIGSPGCEASVMDLQISLVKGLDLVFNLRYPSNKDNKWNNTLSLNREDIAYRLVFDGIARAFGETKYNPLHDINLDVKDRDSRDCRLLSNMLANGKVFSTFLTTNTKMDSSLGNASGRFIDGVTESARNESTGLESNYHYGLFPFLQGKNCSRLDSKNTCYVGEPKLAIFLEKEKGILPPREDSNYSWSCNQIASLIDTLVSNAYQNAYDVLKTEETFQFDPSQYPLQNSSTSLSGEDVLMFYVALANAHVNKPNANFADNSPKADLEAMAAAGIENPEFEFQFHTFQMVFDVFLRN